jgi:hypothetical protein
MKLKLVVASMSVLGLLSCPAFAADAPKHKKHYRHHHKMTRKVAATHDYKDMGALPVQSMMNDWYNRITVDGFINFDTSWGNRSMGYMGENNQRFSINPAQINVNVNVNDWVKGFAAINFDNTSGLLSGASTAANPLTVSNRPMPGVYENIKGSALGANFEQVFLTIGNMDVSPVYLKLGKQFVAFGKYDPHAITRSMTNVLSETLRTAATIGFQTRSGLAAEFFAFDNPMREAASSTSFNSHTKTNYGGQIAFAMPSDSLGFDVGLGYMYDFTGVQDVGYAVSVYNGTNSATTPTYAHRVGAASLYGDINSGPFSFALRYVTALQHFSSSDLPTRATTVAANRANAKPCALDLSAMYKFNAWDRNQNVYLGYQGSRDAVNLYLPKTRLTAGYGMEVWKNTSVGLEVNHDKAYSTTSGSTNDSSNQVHLRVGVKFS